MRRTLFDYPRAVALAGYFYTAFQTARETRANFSLRHSSQVFRPIFPFYSSGLNLFGQTFGIEGTLSARFFSFVSCKLGKKRQMAIS